MQTLGQKETDDVEILVMMSRQPPCVLLGLYLRVSSAQRLRRVNIVFRREQGRLLGHYGMIAVFM